MPLVSGTSFNPCPFGSATASFDVALVALKPVSKSVVAFEVYFSLQRANLISNHLHLPTPQPKSPSQFVELPSIQVLHPRRSTPSRIPISLLPLLQLHHQLQTLLTFGTRQVPRFHHNRRAFLLFASRRSTPCWHRDQNRRSPPVLLFRRTSHWPSTNSWTMPCTLELLNSHIHCSSRNNCSTNRVRLWKHLSMSPICCHTLRHSGPKLIMLSTQTTDDGAVPFFRTPFGQQRQHGIKSCPFNHVLHIDSTDKIMHTKRQWK